MKTQEQIKNFLENEIDDKQLKQIWNDYCDTYCGDDFVYDMDEFDEYIYNNQDEQSDYTELDEFLHEDEEE